MRLSEELGSALSEQASSLKGSKTEAALKEAFADEASDGQKYRWAARRAEAEGYPEAAAAFNKAADEEEMHAHGHLDFLAAIGGDTGDTRQNLEAAVKGESGATHSGYPDMAKTARSEGFDEIANWFDALGQTEGRHEKWFSEVLKTVKKG